ncbi:helix-turn-helix domain-containing protein [Mongoliitalea daihaiensis]|uniref:helix-turn-helix domain-containing protein n=1 Tax=Mongoliitalea daihaiensis TaxID=2782006 RepID=UPI001F248EDB|nr:helix-turn-helix transcriptional regulator [Mongoliitalea daihaiensis]UJP64636.1 helix-turn-helix transcriptional regulator [Mongoliitalea daihaiensis]
MVKQAIHNMQQPQLGLKIQEWRKAKGMTQEELVEKCNINVRTIQRIEAGEVTPRSYTVKAILEALGVEKELPTPTILSNEQLIFPKKSKRTFLAAAIAGCIYFMISMLEIYWDGVLFFDSALKIPEYYIPVKILILISFSLYLVGWSKLGEALDSKLIQWGAFILIAVNLIIIVSDITFAGSMDTDYKLYGFVKLVGFGISFIPFSIGLIFQNGYMGNLFLVTGIVGMLAAILLMTVLFVMVGLAILSVFDILLIYILFSWAFQKERVPV